MKFGETVAVDAEAQTDTPDNAKSIQGVLQLLANMAALQTSQSPQAASLLKSLVVNASGVFVTVRMSLPTEQIQQLVQHAKPAATAAPARRPARRM
ncbi:MAG: hypothetical protein LAQ30_13830 [Acidobacteriia bacterium]|nr:hypothetical protein [Terriglobia bacterium]